MFLDGYIPTENMRFRTESLTFKIADTAEDEVQERVRTFEYGAMKKTLGGFSVDIEPGQFSDSEIIVFLGGECYRIAEGVYNGSQELFLL
jgi:ATP-binding cassette subfamily E protein 1